MGSAFCRLPSVLPFWAGHALVVGAIALLPLLGTAPAQATARLTDLSFSPRADGQGYVVRAQTAGRINAYGAPRQTGPHTLTWTLYNTKRHSDFRKPSPDGPVRSYTVSHQGGHLVLRFRLAKGRKVDANAYRDGASTDLLLNLTYAGGPPVASASDASASDADAANAGGAPDRPVQNASANAAASPGETLDGARERWKLDTVVIDPGHGGKDPGAVGNGLYEKDIVLDVALQLGQYIENRLGVNVVYTRTDDRFIPLEERGHMANKAEAKLFLSLHVNAARAASAQGTETYFLGPSKTKAAEKVMERENSVIKYEDNTETYEEYDEQALVRQTLTQSMYMQKSERLAGLIQNQFEERVHRGNRGVHQAGFYVLWSASMPSVLVELGFLTNDQEARFLSSDRGQDYLASAIFRAVRKYKKQYEKGIVASGE